MELLIISVIILVALWAMWQIVILSWSVLLWLLPIIIKVVIVVVVVVLVVIIIKKLLKGEEA